MDYNCAKEMRDFALTSIENLSRVLIAAEGKCNEEEYTQIKKAVGMSIVKIDAEILLKIYKEFPDLDHIIV